ncbi:MAG: SGNH/GDSL hydrolase family protein [Clostridia bacterium]
MVKEFTNLKKGEYRLKVKFTAENDTLITLYGNHRHFLIKEMAAKKGDVIEKDFAIAIRDADFQKQDNYRDDSLKLCMKGDGCWEFQLTNESFPVIYTLGDSTVCNQEYLGESPYNRCGGWGQALSMFLGDKFAISNHAEQGTHTANCLDCHFLKVEEQLKEGDIVLCQFGHNDQKQNYLKAFEGYYENLVKIGECVKSKNCEFILCTPINRLIYIDGKLNNYLDDYRDGVKKAADYLLVKCIDLHTFTSNLYLEMGDDAEGLFYHSPQLDRTHPNDYGAMKIAEFISKEIRK